MRNAPVCSISLDFCRVGRGMLRLAVLHRRAGDRRRWLLVPLWGMLLLFAGCASFPPEPLSKINFKQLAATQTHGAVTVTAAVIGAESSQRLFGFDLYRQGIQPIWMEIENRSAQTFWYSPVATDRDYYPPLEVAYRNHFWATPEINQQIDERFQALALPFRLPPGSTNTGFVFTQLSVCAKAVNVELHGDREMQHFLFLLHVPGFQADWQLVNFDRLHTQSEHRTVSVAQLRRELELMPSAATDVTSRRTGDPLNVVVVGSFDTVIKSFVRSGWHLTQPLSAVSAWTVLKDFIFGQPYPTAPVSPLYLFGRSQDLALQKARSSLKYRNHLRLWLTSLEFDAKPVWLGQISRDVGVKLTTHAWNLTTHIISPDVDETRDYLLANLAETQALAKMGWVDGVGVAPVTAPQRNLTNDPYYTDGRRVVLVLADEPIPAAIVERLSW